MSMTMQFTDQKHIAAVRSGEYGSGSLYLAPNPVDSHLTYVAAIIYWQQEDGRPAEPTVIGWQGDETDPYLRPRDITTALAARGISYDHPASDVRAREAETQALLRETAISGGWLGRLKSFIASF